MAAKNEERGLRRDLAPPPRPARERFSFIDLPFDRVRRHVVEDHGSVFDHRAGRQGGVLHEALDADGDVVADDRVEEYALIFKSEVVRSVLTVTSTRYRKTLR